jgi:2-polyprenyl-6-hydroxyphenyl methylase / 3-demethylubiquinone-9 3-methyltransferase
MISSDRLRGARELTIDNGLYDAPGDIWWDERQPLSAIRTALNPGRLRYLRGVLEQLGVEPPGKKALDVGCGGGLLAEELARMGFDVTGVDPSEPSLATARRHARSSGLRIEYLAGRGEDLPCADAGYGLVVCCDVLEHVADLDRVIAETARVLEPGGIYVYDTINRTLASKLVMIKLLQEWGWTRLVPPGLHDWRMFVKPSELIGLLEGHGLESRGYTGLAPGGRALLLLRSLIRQRRGAISYGELGRQAAMVPSGRTSILYVGHAVKGSGERATAG